MNLAGNFSLNKTNVDNTQNLQYQVKTSVFEGPLEVLLRLIEERKLFINEISLAQVTDDYIGYIKQLESNGQANIGDITGFVVIAATLILIKSKSLLPNLDLSREEEGQIEDLEERLRLYQAIKEISIQIKSQFGRNIIFPRPDIQYALPVFSPDPAITVKGMLDSIVEVIQNLPKKEFLPEISIRKVINIEEMIGNLIDRVGKSLQLSFSEFSKGSNTEDKKEHKVYVIVSFLAMLELVRGGIINVIQEGNFSEIEMEKTLN